jgi:hypothetical protein
MKCNTCQTYEVYVAPSGTRICSGCAASESHCQIVMCRTGRRVDIRRDDAEPVFDHQVQRDATTQRRTYLCTDPNCDIKLEGHRHYVKRTQ